MTQFDLTPFYRSAIGVDRIASLMDNFITAPQPSQTGWPHYNIIKSGDHTYRITMAVAGFRNEDLDVTTQDQTVIISGKMSSDLDEHTEYLYRGIAGRQFEKRFQLADFIRITGAELRDGLLHVDLLREVPEALKPRKIEIMDGHHLIDDKN